MVVDISAEFPGQNIEAKITEILKAVIYRVNPLLYASLWLNGCGAEVAQLDFNSERYDARLKIGANAFQVSPCNTSMKHTLCRAHGVFDVVNEVVSVVGHGLKTFFNNQINRPAVCIYHLQSGKKTNRAFEISLRGTHMFELKTISGLYSFVELIEEARQGASVLACSESGAVSVERDVARRPTRFRAYVSIMRGCDNFCAYCIVPYVRGRETSRPPQDIEDEVRRLVDDGCREITLLGQNVNSYGKSFDRPGALPELLCRLDRIAGLDRLRFVTSHPKDVTREMLQAVRDLPSVCEHLHMPAQSGSDRILSAMNRSYTSGRYRELLALAKELVPGVSVASDFIVGFPGETEEDFERTASLVREARFQQCFVFKYSPRPRTPAARLVDDVSGEDKRRRNIKLLEIQSAVSADEQRTFIGKDVEVLVEGLSKHDPNRLAGRLRTNQIVVFEGPSELAGKLVRVRVTETTPLTLCGALAETG